ncbi:MAG: hypothetical protein ABMA13_14220 [Chthoniobacteraceae bacterium]
MKDRLRRWLQQNRTSTRLGVVLQAALRIAASLLALVWTPLLLGAMGTARYGLFLSFQSVAALGGLGDFGLGGAISLRTSRHLGAQDHSALDRFLATARGAFLLLACIGLVVFLALSPVLPSALGFEPLPGAGSLPLLFATGSFAIWLLIASSYINNLNYAALNLNWQALPAFVVSQASILAHIWLAQRNAPLSVQYLTYIGSSTCSLALGWWVLHKAQPALARLRPMRLEWPILRQMLADSAWVYVLGLGNFVYLTADRLLINGGIGPAFVPVYQLNNKLPELALMLIVSLTYVAMPKLALWLGSGRDDDRRRTETEAQRLNLIETLLGLAAAFGYLVINDAFIRLWLGDSMSAPLSWQIAFAASLAITIGSNVGIQLSTRVNERGLRFVGIVIGLTALLNFALSFAAMRAGSILGIAAATVLAQSLMTLTISRYLCGRLGLAWARWAARCWLVPVVAVAAVAAVRWHHGWAVTSAAAIGIWLASAWLLGLRPALIRAEWEVWRGILGRGRK